MSYFAEVWARMRADSPMPADKPRSMADDIKPIKIEDDRISWREKRAAMKQLKEMAK